MRKAFWFISGFVSSVALSKKLADYFKRECPGYQAAYDQQKAALDEFIKNKLNTFAIKVLLTANTNQGEDTGQFGF